MGKAKAKKAKAQQREYLPPQGDIGPDTAAQREGAQIVEIRIGGALHLRKRRNHLLDRMHRRGSLTRRQVAAGIELLNRWEATELSPELAWRRVYVDASPRPGDVNVAQLEAKRRYTDLSRWVERDWRWLVQAVVLHEKPIRPVLTRDPERGKAYIRALGEQLNRLAAALRI